MKALTKMCLLNTILSLQWALLLKVSYEAQFLCGYMNNAVHFYFVYINLQISCFHNDLIH